MTDRGGRCAYQAGRASAEPVRPVASWLGRLRAGTGSRLPAVSERPCVPVACAAVALALPSQSAGLTVCGLQCFHGPDAGLQRDKPAINVRLIYRPLQRGMWTIPVSRMHRLRLALYQVKALS
jgi:hypothetical protein